MRSLLTALLPLALVIAALPALGQDDLPPGHPPLDPDGAAEPSSEPLPAGHPPVAGQSPDSKQLLEKLDAMRDELKGRPKTAEIELALANLYYENGRYPEAIDYYRQLIERTAAPLQRYLAARGRPHKTVSPEKAGCAAASKPTFDQLIAIADAKAAAKDDSAAVVCYEAALLPVIGAKARRANAFFLIGNPDRAVAEHREVLAMEPDLPDSLFYLGAILFETADGDAMKLSQAREAWQKFLASKPDAERAKLVKENLAKLDKEAAATAR